MAKKNTKSGKKGVATQRVSREAKEKPINSEYQSFWEGEIVVTVNRQCLLGSCFRLPIRIVGFQTAPIFVLLKQQYICRTPHHSKQRIGFSNRTIGADADVLRAGGGRGSTKDWRRW